MAGIPLHPSALYALLARPAIPHGLRNPPRLEAPSSTAKRLNATHPVPPTQGHTFRARASRTAVRLMCSTPLSIQLGSCCITASAQLYAKWTMCAMMSDTTPAPSRRSRSQTAPQSPLGVECDNGDGTQPAESDERLEHPAPQACQ